MSEPYPAVNKPALRRMLTERRATLTEEARTRIESVIFSRLFSLPAWRQASVIGGYVATRGELDLSPVWRAAVAAGKTYALPVTLTGAREGRMLFRAAPTYCPERLTRGRFGILEPPDTQDFPILPPDRFRGALLLVPGLGFDRDGYRMGYGGGYYDRFLSMLADAGVSVYTVGLCPRACRVERLPREAHDRAVDTVLDELPFPESPSLPPSV